MIDRKLILMLTLLGAACGSRQTNQSVLATTADEPGKLLLTCKNLKSGTSFRLRTLPARNESGTLAQKAGYLTSKNHSSTEPFSCQSAKKGKAGVVTTCQRDMTRVVIGKGHAGDKLVAMVSVVNPKLDPSLRHLLAERLDDCK
jgi:hypothetical protein